MYNKMMEKMLAKKKGGAEEMSGVEKDAKMGVVKAMRDMASNAMNDKLAGLKKVSVASDSSEGLKEGLKKAEELMGAHESDEQPQHEDNKAMDSIDNHSEEAMDQDEGGDSHGLHENGEEDEESPEHEAGESAEEEMSEHPQGENYQPSEYDHLSEDELDAKLAHLMKMKEMKKHK